MTSEDYMARQVLRDSQYLADCDAHGLKPEPNCSKQFPQKFIDPAHVDRGRKNGTPLQVDGSILGVIQEAVADTFEEQQLLETLNMQRTTALFVLGGRNVEEIGHRFLAVVLRNSRLSPRDLNRRWARILPAKLEKALRVLLDEEPEDRCSQITKRAALLNQSQKGGQ